ncbi:MAG: barstar family protein [Sporolactobacillus sp.]
MANNILRIREKDNNLLEKMNQSDCYIVKVDGRQVQSKSELFQEMMIKFKLPDSSGWDSFIDWMTDLSWIDKEKLCLVIYNYSEFLKKDEGDKDIFLEVLQEDILPFWEKNVMETMVNGRVRSFNVYLIG